MKSIINIQNLSFSYGENKVFEDINLKINKGDFAAFIGPNGSGKTTLIELIVGNIKPDKGQAKLYDNRAHQFKDWKKISYLSQDVKNFNNSFPATVKEIIAANLYREMGFFKIINNKIEEIVDKSLEKVNMQKYQDRKIGSLSGGQQQRVFLARGLSTDPEIILLDEPMSGVDKEVQKELYHLLNKLNQKYNITLVMISHDIHVISRYVNRIICFRNEKIYSHLEEDFDYRDYLARTDDEERKYVKEHSH